MKSKSKKVSFLITVVLFIASVVVLFLLIGNGGTVVFAATTPKYTLAYDYSHYYNFNTSKSTDSSATNVLSASMKHTSSGTTTVKLYLYGTSTSGTGNLAKGGTIASSGITVELESGFMSSTVKVLNSSGTELASGSKSVTLPSLSDGSYSISVSLTGAGWNPNSRAYAWYSATLSSSFVVDTKAPTISGASTSKTGKYTSSSFTITASDSGSGVETLYMQEPNRSNFSIVGAVSKTITAGSKNGLYSFYAKDKAGNTSATYYVFYDNTAPTGFLKSEDGSTLTDTYTNKTFFYSAYDLESGIDVFQLKTPGGSWKTYMSGTRIDINGGDGKYTFRAIDKCGLISDEKYVYLDTTVPMGKLYGGTSEVLSGSTTRERYIKFVPSDTLSGVNACYVKEPNATSYVTYVSGSQYSELGTYSFYCVDNAGNTSETYTITLSANHVHQYSSKIVSPTCTSGGYTLHTCSCGDSYTDNATASLGHDFSDWRVTTSATCTQTGIRTATCSRCSETKKETITALGHDYSVLVSSTGDSCLSAGTSVYKCSRCDMTRSITGSALGHNYKITTTAATCTQKGYTTHTCTRCGNSYTDKEVAALGHDYIRSVTEANCVDGGGTKHTCTRCGDTYMTDQTLPLGHSYQITTIEATCTRNGYTLHSCVRCNEEYKSDEVLATGHLYSSVVVRYSTCESDGERYHSCDRCGDEYRTVIPATGHFYQITDEQKSGGTIRRTYTCNVCGDRYTEDLGDQYEKVTTYVEYLFDQYSPYMIWVFLATAGVWSIAIGIAIIIAHKNEDKEKAKKMLVNYLIGIVVIFCIFVACPFLVRGIAILVT